MSFQSQTEATSSSTNNANEVVMPLNFKSKSSYHVTTIMKILMIFSLSLISIIQVNGQQQSPIRSISNSAQSHSTSHHQPFLSQYTHNGKHRHKFKKVVNKEDIMTIKDDGDYDSNDGGDDYGSPHKNGLISATYFVNWAIYARSHFPWNVPLDSVTHVLYAFANVRPETGEVYLTDSWADEQIHWSERGDSWNDVGNNLYGCFNQFRQLKQKHRHLKLLLSIGGWTYSSNFPQATESKEKRAQFSSSALKLLEDYGLDGLDIDWEYPANDAEADQLVDLLKVMRHDLDLHQRSKSDPNPYLLTIAAPCGPEHYKKLHLKQMNKPLSFINLMAYDYAGSWDTVAGHQANLKLLDTKAVNQGNFSTASAVDYYLSQSIPANKLIVGMPLYGRSFLNTKGIGQTYNGVGQGTWESGVYDYKALPRDNCKLVEDKNAVGAYTYDSSAQELVTFDTPTTVGIKVDYVKAKKLGGVMWWESSGDKNKSGEALIPLAASKLGTLDSTYNHLKYPGSKWDNLKNYHPHSPSSEYRQHRSHHHSRHHSPSDHRQHSVASPEC